MSATLSQTPDDNPDPQREQQLIGECKQAVQQGQFQRASALVDSALEQGVPETLRTELLYIRAVAHRYAGAFQSARDTLSELLTLAPELARGYQELGYVQLGLSDPEAAAAAFEQAVALNPALTASWKLLHDIYRQTDRSQLERVSGQLAALEKLPRELVGAIDLMHEGKLHQADQVCRRFLRQHKHDVNGLRTLAEIGVRLDILGEPEFLLETCLELAPDFNAARFDLAQLRIKKKAFTRALQTLAPLHPERSGEESIRLAYAAALAGASEHERALDVYRDILAQNPNRPGVHLQIGHIRKTVGELEAAIESYQAAYRLRPDYGDAYWSLANTKTYRFSDGELQALYQLEQQPGTAVDDRIHLCFAAGKALEDRRAYADAFSFYQRGNALKLAQSGYSPEKVSDYIDQQITHCTAALFDKHAGSGCPDAAPIFIVGLPRSGSTLLEQILASHSMVDSTMELHDILALAQRLHKQPGSQRADYPAVLHDLSPDYLRRFGEQFIADTRAYRGDAPLFIDKMPNNFRHIGLIHLILPNAKIIDARRHPMACGFSVFKQLFGEGQEFSYSLESIAHYYRDYIRLMEHWDRVLPGQVHRVYYEDMVTDFDHQVRRLLDYCGLPFEQQCLEFHKSDRAVKTPSSEQVRQPIYQSGMDQWRHFAAFLDELAEPLADIIASYPLPDGERRE